MPVATVYVFVWTCFASVDVSGTVHSLPGLRAVVFVVVLVLGCSDVWVRSWVYAYVVGWVYGSEWFLGYFSVVDVVVVFVAIVFGYRVFKGEVFGRVVWLLFRFIVADCPVGCVFSCDLEPVFVGFFSTSFGWVFPGF